MRICTNVGPCYDFTQVREVGSALKMQAEAAPETIEKSSAIVFIAMNALRFIPDVFATCHVRRKGPWNGTGLGGVVKIKPDFRLALARDRYVLIDRCSVRA